MADDARRWRRRAAVVGAVAGLAAGVALTPPRTQVRPTSSTFPTETTPVVRGRVPPVAEMVDRIVAVDVFASSRLGRDGRPLEASWVPWSVVGTGREQPGDVGVAWVFAEGATRPIRVGEHVPRWWAELVDVSDDDATFRWRRRTFRVRRSEVPAAQGASCGTGRREMEDLAPLLLDDSLSRFWRPEAPR